MPTNLMVKRSYYRCAGRSRKNTATMPNNFLMRCFCKLKDDKKSKQCLEVLVEAPHEVKGKCGFGYCSGGLESVPGMRAGY